MNTIDPDIVNYLSYDPTSGIITWIKKRLKVSVGKEAGCLHSDGCRIIGFNGKTYKAHRVAWFLHYGENPGEIDHINGIRDDNRIENLRVVTHYENMQNTVHHRNLKIEKYSNYHTIAQAAKALSRPYGTVYKLVKELNICPGEKHKRISNADMQALREELGKRQERKSGKFDKIEEKLDDLKQAMVELIFVQESQSRAIQDINRRIG